MTVDFFNLVCGISDGVFIYYMFVIYEEQYNRALHSCEKEQYTVKNNNKEILSCDMRNISFYIWAEDRIDSRFPTAAANVWLLPPLGLVLLQRAPVSH